MFRFGAKCNKCKLELGAPSAYRIDAEVEGRTHSRATRHSVTVWYVATDGRYIKTAKPYTSVYTGSNPQ